MKKLFKFGVLTTIVVLIVVLIQIVYSSHATGVTDMRLKDGKKFHYLGQVLYKDATSNTTVPAGNYTILINNEDKIKHIVEFEKVGTDIEYETGMIVKGQIDVPLAVNLTPGTWKVYCPLHEKAGMSFYLTVT